MLLVAERSRRQEKKKRRARKEIREREEGMRTVLSDPL